MLIAAVAVLARGPVPVDQVLVEPEQRLRVVEVHEHLVRGDVHVEVLSTRREREDEGEEGERGRG